MTSWLFWNNKAITYVALSLGFAAVGVFSIFIVSPLKN